MIEDEELKNKGWLLEVSLKIKSKIEPSKRHMQMRQCRIRVDHRHDPSTLTKPTETNPEPDSLSFLTSLLDSKRRCPGSLKLSHTESLPWRRKDPQGEVRRGRLLGPLVCSYLVLVVEG